MSRLNMRPRASPGADRSSLKSGQTANVRGRLLAFLACAFVISAAGCGDEQPPRGMIAFSHGLHDDIFEVKPEAGAPVRRLTRLPGAQLDPMWSANGRQIVFRDSRRGINVNDEISVMNADGSGTRTLTRTAANDWSPAWSPDGERIVFASTRRYPLSLWTMRADGRNVRRLTRGVDEYPSWSPDGAWIAYGHGQPDGDIWAVRPDGSDAHALTHDVDNEWLPAWSPSGDRIAFVRGYENDTAIWIMKSDGSGQRRLTNGPHDTAPAWAPDGKRLVFSRNDTLYLVNSNGNDALSLGIKGILPSWRA
jgi:Tol biopolymer transport system component